MQAITPSLKELVRASTEVGCLSFGGPAGQIALMHRIFVDERKWVDEDSFMAALNYCMLLPGPEAQQLATYLGWRWHGALGGVIAGSLFVLPGALVIFLLSWLYASFSDTPALLAFFFGIKAAVLALIAQAMLKIAKRSLRGRLHVAIAVLSFAALLLNVPFALIVLSAAILGILLREQLAPSKAGASVKLTERDRPNTLKTVLVCAAAWFAPLLVSVAWFGSSHVLSQVGLFFSKLAVVTFGGAYAVLADLQQQAVNAQQWLSAKQMLDGLGLAETTPGPLVLVNQFVAFLAGWPQGFVMALACAVMASWCTFAPSFLWIFAGAPYAESLRKNHYAQAALAAISAAVLGVIVKLMLWFAAHVLFQQSHALHLFGLSFEAPELSSFDLRAAVIAAGAAIALFRYQLNVVWLILASLVAGWLIV
jgi:chromate transporter